MKALETLVTSPNFNSEFRISRVEFYFVYPAEYAKDALKISTPTLVGWKSAYESLVDVVVHHPFGAYAHADVTAKCTRQYDQNARAKMNKKSHLILAENI